MNPLQEIQRVHRLFSENPTGISYRRVEKELGISRSTAFRIIKRLREELGAPVVRARRAGLYRYQAGKTYELPGFWLSEGEIGALLGLMQWITGPESSALEDLVGPIRKRLESLAPKLGIDAEKMSSLTALLPMNARVLKPGVLRAVCEGLVEGRRLRIRHGEKEKDLERDASPQKLVRYRDNWYLDAYCHKQEALRQFGLSRIHSALVLKEAAKRIPASELKSHFAEAYGIFTGPAPNEAVLRFTGYAAYHVESESWHPKEKKSRVGETLTLRLPYGDSRELVRDILRWGDDVEVLEPKELRKEVGDRLRSAAGKYPG